MNCVILKLSLWVGEGNLNPLLNLNDIQLVITSASPNTHSYFTSRTPYDLCLSVLALLRQFLDPIAPSTTTEDSVGDFSIYLKT